MPSRLAPVDYSLYLLADRGLLEERELLNATREAIAGGATLVQLRAKELTTRDFYELAHKVKGITKEAGVPLIINDRLDVALAIDADGVHVGQSDLPAGAARQLLGPEKLLGVSCDDVTEALAAQQAGADYVGVGAMFPTSTKRDAGSIGLEGLAEIKAKLEVAVVAIGGIKQSNAVSLKETGIDGICVASAIICTPDPRSAAAELLALWRE